MSVQFEQQSWTRPNAYDKNQYIKSNIFSSVFLTTEINKNPKRISMTDTIIGAFKLWNYDFRSFWMRAHQVLALIPGSVWPAACVFLISLSSFPRYIQLQKSLNIPASWYLVWKWEIKIMSLLISKIIEPSARLSSTISWIIDWIFLFPAKKKKLHGRNKCQRLLGLSWNALWINYR